MFRKLSVTQRVVDIVLACGFFIMIAPISSAWVNIGMLAGVPLEATATYSVIGGIVTTAIFSVALAFRRLSPPLALAIAWLGALAQMATLQAPGLQDIAIMMVLYTTSAYGSRKTMWWGFGSALAGSVLATAYLVVVTGVLNRQPTSATEQQQQLWTIAIVGVVMLIAIAASLVLSWASGLLMRQRIRTQRIEMDREVAQALAVVEQQRSQIARDMHDVVAHSLAVVIAQADGARYASANDPEIATESLRTIASTARSALTDVRLLLAQLRHSQAQGPQPTLADLEGLFAQVRAAGVDLRVTEEMPPREPPASVQLAVFRILQEALTNALRHGDGGPVDVALTWQASHVALRVQNGRGAGIDAPSGGHGLVGMRERAMLVGGTLEAAPDGSAFVVTASIPMPPATEGDSA